MEVPCHHRQVDKVLFVVGHELGSKNLLLVASNLDLHLEPEHLGL